MSKLSDTLIALRKREKLSQTELASRLGLSSSAVAMYETGRRIPKLETLEAYADVFNVSMDYLIGLEDAGNHVAMDDYPPNILKLCDIATKLPYGDLMELLDYAEWKLSRVNIR